MKYKLIFVYLAVFAFILLAIVFFDSRNNNSERTKKIPADIQQKEMPQDAIHKGLGNPAAGQPSRENVLASVKEKMKKLEEAIANNPDDTVKIREYANFLLAAHKPEKALKYYKMILDKNPERTDILLSVTSIYFNKGDYKKAEETTRQILRYDKNNLEAQYNLGVIFAVTGKKSEAEIIWKDLIEKHPGTEVANLAKSALQKL